MDTFRAVIQQTVHEFRTEYSAWENEVQDLFNDMDQFLETGELSDASTVSQEVADDVAGLKGLVEQQTEVLSALVNALTGSPGVEDLTDEVDDPQSDSSMNGVDPFERLQQAVAAATDAA